MGAFLYPRGLRPDGTTHFHQGIDLSPHYDGINSKKRHRSDFESDPDGKLKPRADIVSVVAGKVVNKPEETGTGNYGLMVVIGPMTRSRSTEKRYNCSTRTLTAIPSM